MWIAANRRNKLEGLLQLISQGLFQIYRYLRFDKRQGVFGVILCVRSNDDGVYGAVHIASHMGWVMKRFHFTNIQFILSGYYRSFNIVADRNNLMTLVLND